MLQDVQIVFYVYYMVYIPVFLSFDGWNIAARLI